jgi:predicted AAA+ superfamily ATPase
MIQRDDYVNKLIRKEWNGRIKVITGIRRCGKSTILFELFRDHLRREGIADDNIIEISLDQNRFEALRAPDALAAYIRKRITRPEKRYYVLIDEIQYAIRSKDLKNKDGPVPIYSVLNEFLAMKNVDVYVTGSNSKLLSKDISTEFRGRGDIIRVYPLSFREYLSGTKLDKRDAYDEYIMYGGMPYLTRLEDDEEKYTYLSDLFEEIYFKDIEERYSISMPGVLREMTSVLCSSVGFLTNASKLARTIQSEKHLSVSSETISAYLEYLKDAFLFAEALRYDVKGRKYFGYPSKYYCTDIGLRNVRLGLRQMEETHIMENCIYNELLIRGFAVDVGVIPIREPDENKIIHQKNTEIDFIARKGNKTYYIQSALSMDNPEKEQAELRPLNAVKDSFRKIIISKSYGKSWIDDKGILRLGILDFLLDQNSLDR